MNLQPRTPEEPEVNLTSLIDVVLLLLVFFMVSTSFVRDAELKIRLPGAEAEPTDPGRVEFLEITITRQGSYLLNQKSLVNNRPETLRRAIRKAAGDNRDLPVVIRADADARHQAVVTAMDVAGRLGFVRINIATTGTDDAN